MSLDYQTIMDTMKLVQKRLAILGGARIRHRFKTIQAIKLQDSLRAKHSNIKKEWRGTDEIRKWRERLKG